MLKEINDESEINDGVVVRIINTLKGINTKIAKNMIKNADDKLFDSVLIKKLMFLSYDYEILEKLFGIRNNINIFKLNKIINIFNQIYEIDYKKEIKFLDIKDYDKKEYIKLSRITYENVKYEIEKYMNLFSNILNYSGYTKEFKKIIKELEQYNINIIYNTQQSSYVKLLNKEIFLYLNNNTKATLYHEYTHVIQQIVRKIYNIKLKGFEITLQSEGIANFFAYNLLNNISLQTFKNINLKYVFFPRYSYLYKVIYNKGFRSAKKNYNLIRKEYETLGYKNESEILNLHYRFFKFFPMAQNKYLYPKELLYKIGYEKVNRYPRPYRRGT